jgi:hypothetical protein
MWIKLIRVVLPVALAVAPTATATAQPSSDFSLTLSPSRVIVPADQIGRSRQFTLTNRGRNPLDVTVRRSPFSADSEGNLRLHADAPHSAAEWITITPDRFRVPARAAKRVSLRVAVPTGTESGEHQAAVLFSVAAPAGEPGVGVARSLGAPVYVNTPGPVVDSTEVTALHARDFAVGGPLDLTATVRNTGTRHRDFVGDDRLRAEVTGGSVPFPDFTLTRAGSQEITTRWTNPPLLCVCQVSLAVPEPNGTSRGATTTIVILPLHLIGPALVLLLALPALGWLLSRRLRSRRAADVGLSRAGGGHA